MLRWRIAGIAGGATIGRVVHNTRGVVARSVVADYFVSIVVVLTRSNFYCGVDRVALVCLFLFLLL